MRIIVTVLFLFIFANVNAGKSVFSKLNQTKDSTSLRFNRSFHSGFGYVKFLGDFKQYHEYTVPWSFGIQFSFNRFSFNLGGFTGSNMPKKNILTPSYYIPDDRLNYFGVYEIGIGYEIIRKRNWQVIPQFGISTFQMGWTNVEIDENDSPVVVNISIANDVVYRFFRFNFKNGGAIGFDLRYRISGAPFIFKEEPRGVFFNNQISIGVFGYFGNFEIQ